MTSASFETRLQRFHDSCTPEEQQMVAVMCGLFVAAGQLDAGEVTGYTYSSAGSAPASADDERYESERPDEV